MANSVHVGKYMYAIFSGKTGKYVQPCKVTEVTDDGFWAECHNGGADGHRLGKEFFRTEDIGHGVFYSKDSAQVVIDRVYKTRCGSYVGVTCVNGSCPNALADEYPEYGYEHCTCEECGYYKGCEDCALAGTPHCERSGGNVSRT